MTLQEQLLSGRPTIKTGTKLNIDRLQWPSRPSRTPYTYSSSPRALYNNRKMIIGG